MFGKGIDIKKALNADISGNSEIYFNGISTDSRTIGDGEVFLALIGKNFDGHRFIEGLIGKAKGFIVNRNFDLKGDKNFFVIKVDDTLKAYSKLANYWRKRCKVKVIGISGSLGKTTTKELIAGVLSKRYRILKTYENLNNIIGLSKMLLSLRDEDFAVLEMGINNVYEMRELCETAEPDYGVITNIAPVHLEGLKSMANVYEEKKILFDYSKNAVFINNEDSFLKNYSRDSVEKIYFGKGSSYRYGEHKIIDFKMMMVDIFINEKKITVEFPYINLGFPILLCLSCGVGSYFNISPEEAKSAISSVKLPKLRMQILEKNGKKIILDAYNANPVSIKYALKTIMELDGNRKSVVLGDIKELGRFSRYYHTLIAKNLAKLPLKNIVLVGEEMRYAHDYLNKKLIKHYYYYDSLSARDIFNRILEDSDVVLIKGSRGVQLERIIGEN